MATETSTRPCAVVTGASSGIGAAFAQRLARDGHNLVIVARRRDRLDTLARQIEASQPISVEVLVADLAKPGDLRTVEARVANEPNLALLVNNAGFGSYMPFVDLDPDRAEEQIHLQVVAVTRLTRAALPGMIARGRGAIVNVSSRLAFSASLNAPYLPKRATYAATKAYLNTFTQILQGELAGTGVQAQVLCPGLVKTEFHERMGLDPSRLPAASVMSPEAVVEASLAGLRLGEVVCIPALGDPALLTAIDDAQRQMLEQSNSGQPAKRYSA